MRIVVHPQRGYYRLFFLDGGKVILVGQVDLVRTTKGFRPKDYLERKPGSRHGRSLPTKDLIASLRQAEVRLTRRDEQWEAFLSDLQI
ncbi:MAG: DEAD/DEAH box helicase, partial [Methanomicrobiales archaeon]|nr:DEAD/DEAH box helicase [Methanomicrobiales archaeon]